MLRWDIVWSRYPLEVVQVVVGRVGELVLPAPGVGILNAPVAPQTSNGLIVRNEGLMILDPVHLDQQQVIGLVLVLGVFVLDLELEKFFK